MKKTTIILVATLLSLSAFAQQTKQDTAKLNKQTATVSVKQDTTIQVVMSLEQYKMLLYKIDSNIDSKKESKEIVQFLQQSARIMEAEKPKAFPKPEPKK